MSKKNSVVACQICNDGKPVSELFYNEAKHGINICPDCGETAKADVVDSEIQALVGKGKTKKVAKAEVESEKYQEKIDKKVIALLSELIEEDNSGASEVNNEVEVETTNKPKKEKAMKETTATTKEEVIQKPVKTVAELKTSLKKLEAKLEDADDDDVISELQEKIAKMKSRISKAKKAEKSAPAAPAKSEKATKPAKAEKVKPAKEEKKPAKVAKMPKFKTVDEMEEYLTELREQRSNSDDRDEKKNLTEQINALKPMIREAKQGAKSEKKSPAKAEKVKPAKEEKKSSKKSSSSSTDEEFVVQISLADIMKAVKKGAGDKDDVKSELAILAFKRLDSVLKENGTNVTKLMK